MRISDWSSDVCSSDLPRERHWTIRACQVVIAAGAIERPIVFGDNDKPGQILADAGRIYVERHGVAPGRQVALFTNNDGAYRSIAALTAASVTVAAIVEAPREIGAAARNIAAASDRKSAVEGKSGSVRVDLGGGPIHKKNKNNTTA